MYILWIAPKSVGFTLQMALNYMVNHIHDKIKLCEWNSVFNHFQTLAREILRWQMYFMTFGVDNKQPEP